ncbi:hypothetical protein [Neotabrizicola sp. sgz301269]|uniref:hypothetical protein n=1 Tax=Neotabrizicola sp. sgz301269 TaxID=3276282 RepID=UPI00376F7E22
MRQFLLATALVGGAVALFFGGRAFLLPLAAQPLGDLSALSTIVSDVQDIAGTGNLAGAKVRIKDLETTWDADEDAMRPKDPEAWGRVDAAADDALSALRAVQPDDAKVTKTLATLQTVLADPAGGGDVPGGVQMVKGIAVSDASGHPLPCEVMIQQVRDEQTAKPGSADVADLLSKATERCNADDDKNANSFSAQALAALAGG